MMRTMTGINRPSGGNRQALDGARKVYPSVATTSARNVLNAGEGRKPS